MALTDKHLVLFKRSKFNAMPVAVIGTFERDALVPAGDTRCTRVPLGDEDVWATRSEYKALPAG